MIFAMGFSWFSYGLVMVLDGFRTRFGHDLAMVWTWFKHGIGKGGFSSSLPIVYIKGK